MNKQTQNTIWALESELRSHKNEIARLKEALASVEKDAARYRYLRSRAQTTGAIRWDDAEIDEAMKGET